MVNTYADALPELVLGSNAEEAPEPHLLILNEQLAEDLGLDVEWLRSDEGINFLTGHGSTTHSMAYAGHQFGQYSPILGDGRAVLLGELETPEGLRDLHVKGTGRTRFSRGGDGRGTLTSMLREFLYSESLAALGCDTTRSLAVITTGRQVVRENGVEPAALLVRVARGLSRVGTFQLARSQSPELVQRLADYEIARHYPGSSYLEFFESILARQTRTVSSWMRIGFIHGVMNTDNTSITGETLDYGPCAFTGRFDPDAVYSSIDTEGRYAFGNQPPMLRWNLTRLAETLLELVDLDTLQASLNRFDDVYREAADDQARTVLGDADRKEIDAYEQGLREADDITAYNAGPRYIPRNHLVDHALKQARRGDFAPYEELLQAVTNPYDDFGEELASPEPEDFGPFMTFCGT